MLAIVEKTHVSVTFKIDNEKESEIVKLSDTNKSKLSKNQKNKMSICSDSVREKSSLYKKYSEELWKTCYNNILTTLAMLAMNLVTINY